MNIFVLSRNVRACARMHCDKHVVKMPLETAQILSTVLAEADPAAHAALRERGLAYKPTHAAHPCTRWAGASLNNYLWLAALGRELGAEYTYRYGRVHASAAVIEALAAARPPLPRARCVSPFAQALPEELRSGDAVAAYRRYYVECKAPIARWTKRERPAWFPAAAE